MAQLIAEQLSAVRSLIEAQANLEPPPEVVASTAAAADRRYFRPNEEGLLWDWYSRFVTVRGALWELMEEAAGVLERDPSRVRSRLEWQVFLVAYASACGVVGLDRLLVERFATSRFVQRKLNEGDLRHRIPRKTFTAIYRSLASPRNALRMEQAMTVRRADGGLLATLGDDPLCGWLVERLPELELALDPSRLHYLGLWFRYRLHSLRRRSASSRQQGTFAVLEGSGRTLAELKRRHAPAVDRQTFEVLSGLIRAGDVIVTRQEGALTNLVLPGYWPHVALCIGTSAERSELGVALDSDRAARASDPVRVLEARADGVRFRPLAETLAVDAVAVIRPQLPPASIARAIERASEHEGKLYNFDFDFFRSDRLVCTEVVYRAFDGLDRLELPLRERAGRPTLSAEDLLARALAEQGFNVAAVFGAPRAPRAVVTGFAAGEMIRASLG